MFIFNVNESDTEVSDGAIAPSSPALAPPLSICIFSWLNQNLLIEIQSLN